MDFERERIRRTQERRKNEHIAYYRKQFEIRLKQYENVWDESKYTPQFVKCRLIRGEGEPCRVYEPRQNRLLQGADIIGSRKTYPDIEAEFRRKKQVAKWKREARPKVASIKHIRECWLNQEAKLILGAMKRNIKTTQQSRLPFRDYVTQRPDSGWKNSFRIEKQLDGVRLIGPAQNKAISLSQTFEYGGNITWSYGGLYSESTRVLKGAFGRVVGNKSRRKKAFSGFLSHERKLRNALAKVEKDGCKFDYYKGFMQEATIRALRYISSRDGDPYDWLVGYYKSRWYKKHSKYVHYPFASKTFKELQGYRAFSPRYFSVNVKGGPEAMLTKDLRRATQEVLDQFCKEWNRTHPQKKQRLPRSLLERQIRLANTPYSKKPIKTQNKTACSVHALFC